MHRGAVRVGKSSLLRLLDRLRDPDRGEVRYRGRDVRTYDVLELRAPCRSYRSCRR